jgi:hypothetical protein
MMPGSGFVVWESSRDPRFARFGARLEMLGGEELADSLPNDAGFVVVSTRLQRYLEDKRVPRLEYRPAALLDRAGRPLRDEYVIILPPQIEKPEKKLVIFKHAAGVVMRLPFAEELIEEGFSGIAFRELDTI